MSIDHQDDEQIASVEEDAEDFSAPALMDPVAAAIALRDVVAAFSNAYKLVTTDKAKAAQLRAVDKLDRRAAKAVAVRDEARAEAAAIVAKIERDTNALAERERALDARDAAFASSLQEARDHLRAYYDSLADMDRRIRYRILSHAGLLHGFNERLQDLPDWPAIERMVPGLSPDLPAAPAAEVISENVREDWSGNVFAAGATVTRSINKAVS
jgi:hypothetical protein